MNGKIAFIVLCTITSWAASAEEIPATSAATGSAQIEAQTESANSTEVTSYRGDIWSRSTLSGDWGGMRGSLAAHGLTLDVGATYLFQGVAGGGFNGPRFNGFSDEDETGNTFSGDAKLELDTEKAGLWHGGYLAARIEGRSGRSVMQRAGSVSAVNSDALYPNVVDRFDESALAVTELSFTQYMSESVAFYGGLLNMAEGDANEIAGSSLSDNHFLNSALLYSLVEDATVPNTALGGGILYEPSDSISGSFSISGTQETAGEDPFQFTHGTTFSTEWTFGHELLAHGGAQTFGVLYGIDTSRTNIAANPRLVLGNILAGRPIPTTTDDTWAFYYNAHQYLSGDAEKGWGLFARFGMSDGDPNPVKYNVAGGLGGKGLLPQRPQDSWGLGVFYIDFSNEDLLQTLNVGDETGSEIFYNIAITPSFRVTLDAQVIDSALPQAATTCVLGIRTHVDL
jgi:porin